MTTRQTDIRKIAELLRDLDFGMLTTRTKDGAFRSRPMSNNGEVEFDGDVWFFSDAGSRKVKEIGADPHVELSYADPSRFLFIAMSATAEIVRDDAKKRELWIPELEQWFDGGPESDDIVLLKVTPDVVEYWNGEDSGEVRLG